ncbi:MAG: 23S rRNA (adenine(2503)-C(2))-methyltransferase RlmN [Eubacterium sp.]|nr:23S rRNA (adenine(2503)-C(2))-methyltransferase RlmN [Eubacterium sp.]
MVDIKSMSLKELENYIESLGEKRFRAKQIYEWMHVKLIEDFDEMTNISKSLRETLKENASLCTMKIKEVQTAEDGTQKFLFETYDGEFVESVKMVYKHGISVCISSQIGCRMGCTFCASTVGGLIRSLAAGEMLEQIYRIQRYTNERVHNVVVMGMGEPFDNYDELVKFLHMVSDENGLNISGRNLTVSTCGLCDKIREFAEEGFTCTLALSLHASNQATRERLMPIAKMYSFDEVLSACDYYFEKTGRRVTFEYSMADGINDSDEDAENLYRAVGKKNCHINLIPINPVRENGYKESEGQRIAAFKNKLEKYGINVTIRREMGRGIDAACGQLRKRYKDV